MIPRHLQFAIAILLTGVLGTGVYMLKLRQREEVKSKTPLNTARPLAAPVAGPSEPVRLVVAYDEDGVFSRREISLPLPEERSAKVKEVVHALLSLYADRPSPHPIHENADVRNVFLVEGGLCVVDLNAAFAEGHRSGILVEQFTLASMVQTIAANFSGIKNVKFLVEGQERETLAGHADLRAVYSVARADEFVDDLQKQESKP
ncbi:MAG TPA: GerMN domain-containing protein [Terriglobales bacterium]|nr:GerMN domain-containing protein [Terriglobales bacterium]